MVLKEWHFRLQVLGSHGNRAIPSDWGGKTKTLRGHSVSYPEAAAVGDLRMKVSPQIQGRTNGAGQESKDLWESRVLAGYLDYGTTAL